MTLDAEQQLKLEGSLAEHEGFRAKPYLDSKGYWTVGFGTQFHHGLPRYVLMALFNEGVTRDMAAAMMRASIEHAMLELQRALPWVENLDPVRQRALVELTYNMGLGDAEHGLLSFKHTLAAMRRGDWQRAYDGLLTSKWARDVGPTRAHRIADMVLTGLDPI